MPIKIGIAIIQRFIIVVIKYTIWLYVLHNLLYTIIVYSLTSLHIVVKLYFL
jgi:hypothetical protein